MTPVGLLAVVPLQLPPIAWRVIAPELALLAAAVATLLLVAIQPRGASRAGLGFLSLAGLATSAGLLAWNWHLHAVGFSGTMVSDGISRYATVVLLAVGAVGVLMALQEEEQDTHSPDETVPLLLFALTGMVVLASATDLLVAFIALEVLSLALYILAGSTRRLAAQEAAMKYFLLGAFSSSFLLYGIALFYGATGTVSLSGIAGALALPTVSMPLVLAGVALLAVGFAFKVSAVPFHMWTPDVYQGSPTPVSAFMSAGTKTAAFAILLRVFAGTLGSLHASWQPELAAIAAITMLVGAVLAVVQSDLKRLLAYSSVSHAGYLLIGIVAATRAGASASMFYLLTYSLTVMGAFAVLQYVNHSGEERTSVEDLRGFARQHPVVGGVLALCLFSLAGVPPLAGFWGKYYLFQAGLNAGWGWLVIIGILSSVISAFFYLRVVVVTFLEERQEGARSTRALPVLNLALGASAVATVVIGLIPGVFIAGAAAAGQLFG